MSGSRLKPHAARVEVWKTVYSHVLDGAEAIVAWFLGTGLKPFVDPLGEAERAAFLAAHLERLRAAYPPRVDGKVLLRFPCLFFVAIR